ncbi:hypothetical protein [Sphingomonas turrisvirgatae]|nr:hypothetical protein [Sphingomonas turrisvirgatae]
MTEQAQSAATPQESGGNRPWLIISLVALPLILIMGFLSAQTYIQDGVPVWLADWQFGRFGQSLPIFNIAIFVAVATLVGILIDLLVRLIRREADADRKTASVSAQAQAHDAERQEALSAILSAGRFARLLRIVGATVMVMAVTIAVWALLLPRGAEAVVFGTAPNAATRVIQGRPDGRLMVTTVNDVLLYRESAFFVPVIDPAEPRMIRRFVEFVPDGSWNGSAVPQVDMSQPLRAYRIALPAFMPTLYAGNGYTLAKPYEVLTNRPISIQLPYYITAVQLALIALVFLVAAWIQHRHLKRLEAKEKRRVGAPAEAGI